MVSYFSAFAWVMLLSIFYPQNTANRLNSKIKKRNQKLILFISILPALFLQMFRNKLVGLHDPRVYYAEFSVYRNHSWSYLFNVRTKEYGYYGFVKLLGYITDWPQTLFIVTAVFVLAVVCWFFYKNSENPCVAFLGYMAFGMYFFNWLGLRQAIAMSFCLIATEMVKNKKYVKAVLLIAVAATFHLSALAFALLFLFGTRKIDGKNFGINILFALLFFAFLDPILNFGNKLLGTDYEEVYFGVGYTVIAIYLAVLISGYIFRKQLSENKNNILLYNMSFIGFVIYLSRFFGSQVFQRISYYFYFAVFALIPNIIKLIKPKELRIIIYIVVFVAFSLLFYQRCQESQLLPFYYFWQSAKV